MPCTTIPYLTIYTSSSHGTHCSCNKQQPAAPSLLAAAARHHEVLYLSEQGSSPAQVDGQRVHSWGFGYGVVQPLNLTLDALQRTQHTTQLLWYYKCILVCVCVCVCVRMCACVI